MFTMYVLSYKHYYLAINGIFEKETYIKQFLIKSPLLFPFELHRHYHRDLWTPSQEQSDFLTKLFGEEIEGFARNFLSFRFTFTDLPTI